MVREKIMHQKKGRISKSNNITIKKNSNNDKFIQEHVFYIIGALNLNEGQIGRNALRLILKGSKNKILLNHELNKNPFYGKLSHLTLEKIKTLINKTINDKFIYIKYKGLHNLPYLFINKNGSRLLKNYEYNQSFINIIKNLTPEQHLSIFKIKSDEKKRNFLAQIVTLDKIEILELFSIKLKKRDINLLIEFLSDKPDRKFTAILFSILFRDNISVKSKLVVLNTLKSAIEDDHDLRIRTLLSGLQPFLTGKLSREAIKILND